MKIDISQNGKVTILACNGSLDAQSVADFKKIAYGLVDDGTNKIVVDFTKLNFVDSVGLGALVSLLRRARENEGDVKLASLNDDVKTIFEITRLHKLFTLHSDWQTACKEF